MTRYSTKTLLACAAAAALVSVSGTAMAVPYAAQVSVSGTTVNWVLNEDADSVIITVNGSPQAPVAGVAGAQSFSLGSASDTWSIEVTNSEAAGYADSQVSTTNPLMEFERANGVAVNNNPGSEYFGAFYISHRAETSTATGRTLGDGVYMFNADGTDYGGITDPNDITAARNGGGTLTTYFTNGGSSSPWRIEVDKDDNLIISDWSDANGGVFLANADVSNSQLLLSGPGGVTDDVNDVAGGGANPLQHGSVASTPVFTGSLSGGDFVLYTIDEDKSIDENGTPTTGSFQNVWRYDIGSTPSASGYAGQAMLELDGGTLGANSDGSRILFNDIISVDMDLTYDPVHDNFIITQPRYTGSETGLLILDGDMSTVLFNSLQFSIDNNLDGAEDDFLEPAYDGIQDIFRASHDAVVSPDGSYMVISRRNDYDSGTGLNDFFGPGNLLVVPLDADGVPVLDLTDAGLATPDLINQEISLGTTSIETAATGNNFRAPVAMDLAGNLYVTYNINEIAQVFSLGGDHTAITSSDGTFTIDGVTYGGGGCGDLVGDLNCDGFVGIADLNIVLGDWNNSPPNNPLADPTGDNFVGIEDLNLVLGNWNAGTPPTAAVPEPATLALLGLGGLAMIKRRR